ncbi:right-handed parallel beta-helix repeat-containing protein [Microbacterium lacus]|uniref:right-handed parallel beta-helix repeat-containing protein n=1 Tax=Microbacterium lacus TaxID=415217 RepID=UPI00384E649E
MSRSRRFFGTLLMTLAVIATACVAGVVFNNPPAIAAATDASTDTAAMITGDPYLGNPDAETVLVAAEQERIDFVKSIGTSVEWQVERVEGPFRVPTTPAATLVLTAREAPYTRADLQRLAPDTFVAQADGSFLLSENVLALSGATLDLTSTAPPPIKLLSTPSTFVSIVTVGSAVTITGTAEQVAEFTSFDPASGAADTSTADGRAYIRAIGGTVNISHASFSDLGFWAGDTGGLSLTGANDAVAVPIAPGALEVGGAPTISEAEVTELTADEQPAPSMIGGKIYNVTLTRNAFGLFISSASGVTISQSSVTDNLIDGLVLHRDVADTAITAVQANGNARDGIVVEQSSSGITMSAVTASENGRNGIGIDGRPLVTGPSANGTAVTEYGDVHVSESTVSDNGRYGVQVMGGSAISVTDSDVTGNLVGVALNRGSTEVQITGNTFTAQQRQSISVGGGVSASVIDSNRFESVDTGVRIDGAAALVEDNVFADIGNHAVTLVGDATGVRVTGNTISGDGSTPFYDNATGGFFAGNDVDGWAKPVTPTSVAQTVAQPLTLLWIGLGAILLITAIAGSRRRATGDLYLERRPLTEISRGIVSVDDLRGPRS